MTIKYMLGNTWSYIEGTHVRYTKFNAGNAREKINLEEKDEIGKYQAIYDYIHSEAQRQLGVKPDENEIMAVRSAIDVSVVCVVVIYDRERDRQTILYTDDTTFLLNETGKTIERLL